MLVIKLGGSLLASGLLGQCLDKIAHNYSNQAVLIVPGGGVFAEQVRQLQTKWRFNDRIAHEMAILAMRQMALLIKGLKPQFQIIHQTSQFKETQALAAISVWSPDISDLDAGAVPANWHVTSDSLSAWLAKIVNASTLIVVKSAKIDCNLSHNNLAEQNIVDPLFLAFAQQGTFSTTIVNVKDFIYGCSQHGSE